MQNLKKTPNKYIFFHSPSQGGISCLSGQIPVFETKTLLQVKDNLKPEDHTSAEKRQPSDISCKPWDRGNFSINFKIEGITLKL